VPSPFSLGDGVNSISGRGVGRGIILNEIQPSKDPVKLGFEQPPSSTPRELIVDQNPASSAPARVVSALYLDENPQLCKPYNKKSLIPKITAERKEVGFVECNVHLITDYQQIRTVLKISASLSTSVALSGSVSADMNFANDITLDSENLTLVVVIRNISHADIIPKHSDLTIDNDQCKLVKDNPITFVNSNGDHYVSEVTYGAALYAVIKIRHVTKDKGEEFKQSLNGKLQEIISGSSSARYKKNEFFERAEMSIEMIHIGVPGLGVPPVCTRLEEFVGFVAKFNKQTLENIKKGVVKYPIGHATEPYTTLLKFPEASNLYDNIKMTTDLLRGLDHLQCRIRLVTPTAKRIVEMASSLPKKAENDKKIVRLRMIYQDAERCLNYISTTILKITSAQTNLTALKLKLPGRLDNSMKNRPQLLGQNLVPVNPSEYELQTRALEARDKVVSLTRQYADFVEKLEREVVSVVTSLENNIVTLKFPEKYFDNWHWSDTQHFHIKIPGSSCRLQWRIVDLEDKPIEDIQLDVLLKKKFFYWAHLKKLGHTAITDLTGVGSRHRYKIASVRTSDGSIFMGAFKVLISVCGELALKIHDGGKALNNLADELADCKRDEIVQGQIDVFDCSTSSLPHALKVGSSIMPPMDRNSSGYGRSMLLSSFVDQSVSPMTEDEDVESRLMGEQGHSQQTGVTLRSSVDQLELETSVRPPVDATPKPSTASLVGLFSSSNSQSDKKEPDHITPYSKGSQT
jgi:hypothetical protein